MLLLPCKLCHMAQVISLVLFLPSCGARPPESEARQHTVSQSDTGDEVNVLVSHPASLSSIATPYVELGLTIQNRERMRIARVIVNGVAALPRGGLSKASAYHVVIPLERPAGYIRVVLQPSAAVRQDPAVFCFPYSCDIPKGFAKVRRSVLDDLYSPDARLRAGAILRLQGEPDVAEVGELAGVMEASPSPELQMTLARLLGGWQALDAVGPMLRLLAAERDPARREKYKDQLCSIGGYVLEESDNPCWSSETLTREGEVWFHDWFQTNGRALQEERFPKSCTGP